ncbi:hypothetical protein Q9R08_18810 [Microbacterium sp. QXD-8]|uniref:Uncharacterized protein n=1 Tax=Microbacterium psychrotolerans TaxID=3068321 RepID=A0ABU0Z626_9MICO|nr:hypothetical protein [Microbacterium sp. QXD-8]MDQ7880048.1 hypothetical protein [Microbacterium sp. QXD-8]
MSDVAAPAPASTSPSPVMSPPTPSPSSKSDPALISARGIGPYILGGSFAEALELLGVAEERSLPAEGFEDRCPWFASATGLDSLMTYVIADVVQESGVSAATDVIHSVSVQDGGAAGMLLPLTDAGVGLRSSEEDVRAVYPDAATEDALNADSALRVTEGRGAIVFEFRDGVAYFITVLPASEPLPAEYCG